MRNLFRFLVLAALAFPGIVADLSARETGDTGEGGIDLDFTHSISGLGTRETTSREIGGVKVTFPVDEADTVEALQPFLEGWLEKRAEAAREEAEGLAKSFRDPEIHELVLKNVQSLLGGGALSDDVGDVLRKGSDEIARLAEQWRRWSGRPSEIRIFNGATMAPFREGPAVKFEEVSYEGSEESEDSGKGTLQIGLHVPFLTAAIGRDSFDPTGEGVAGMKLDLPIFAPPGIGAERIATEHGKILMEIQGILRRTAVTEIGASSMHYLVEKLLIHEIESRYLASPSSRVISRALARLYLFALLNRNRPTDEGALQQMLSRLLSIELPEDREEAEDFLERLSRVDPLGDVPDELETAASRILTFAILQKSQGDAQGMVTLQLFDSLGIETPEGGFDGDAFRDALGQAYEGWDEHLKETRVGMVTRWRELVAEQSSSGPEGAEEEKEVDYPERYETLSFDGLTFRFPPEVREAVEKVGPQWATDWNKAQAIFQERFGGPWKERLMLTDKDFEGMGRYGVEPIREEAVMWAVLANLTSNIEKWALKLISGDEVGVWFREDMVEAVGDVGRFGGIRFDVREKSASFGMPNFRWGKEIGPDTKGEDLAKMIESQPALVFPVLLKKDNVEGKPMDERVKAMEEGDLFLRDLSRGAAELDPKDLGGGTPRILSDEQSFFIMVHEAIESALVRQVIGSRDRRWFCDGLAYLVAIWECDRRFGEGSGMKAFESMFNPERSRGMADAVDLLAWPAVGDEDPSLDKVEGRESAHYYFATLAMLEAVKEMEDDFIRRWVEVIRKTPWNRTNAETVMDAYRELAGKELEPIVSGITASPE